MVFKPQVEVITTHVEWVIKFRNTFGLEQSRPHRLQLSWTCELPVTRQYRMINRMAMTCASSSLIYKTIKHVRRRKLLTVWSGRRSVQSNSLEVNGEQTSLIKCMCSICTIYCISCRLFSLFTNHDKNSPEKGHFHTSSVKAKGFSCILWRPTQGVTLSVLQVQRYLPDMEGILMGLSFELIFHAEEPTQQGVL